MTEETPKTDAVDPEQKNIRAAVASVLGDLFSSGKARVSVEDAPAPTREHRQDDVANQVRSAVKAAKSEEKRDSLVETLSAEVSALKAKMEQAPIRRRPVENVMKWHLDEES